MNFPAKRFFSQNFIHATKSFTEVMFVLALMDLPLGEPEEPNVITENNRVTFQSITPALIFYKELEV